MYCLGYLLFAVRYCIIVKRKLPVEDFMIAHDISMDLRLALLGFIKYSLRATIHHILILSCFSVYFIDITIQFLCTDAI